MNEIDFIQPKKTVGKLISIDVLDKIRAEIEQSKYYRALYIIDKYADGVSSEKKTGHWITKRTIMHDGEFYCDVCDNDAPFNKTSRFCPNCGAKMVEPQESEEKKI